MDLETINTAAMDILWPKPIRNTRFSKALLRSISALLLLSALALHGEVRFDVFLGFDGIVPEGTWFPVVFEVANDGPAFKATVELTPGGYSQTQTRSIVLELPTGTLKRFVIPVFASSSSAYNWNARLLDERGRVRAESQNLRIRKTFPSALPIAGAMPRTAHGMPTFPELKSKNNAYQPVAARLQPNIFPDNPIGLEGLDTLYLNPERALELRSEQARTLLAWVYSGGHLIVGVEQPIHVNGNEWLRKLIPIDVKELITPRRILKSSTG